MIFMTIENICSLEEALAVTLLRASVPRCSVVPLVCGDSSIPFRVLILLTSMMMFSMLKLVQLLIFSLLPQFGLLNLTVIGF